MVSYLFHINYNLSYLIELIPLQFCGFYIGVSKRCHYFETNTHPPSRFWRFTGYIYSSHFFHENLSNCIIWYLKYSSKLSRITHSFILMASWVCFASIPVFCSSELGLVMPPHVFSITERDWPSPVLIGYYYLYPIRKVL